MASQNGQTVNPPSIEKSRDDAYLEIWKIEQEHTRTRWTVTTFFLGVSFAIYGFSFQSQIGVNPNIAHLQRIVGIVVYWFAFAVFLQFSKYNNFLRAQLQKMEDKKQVTFSLQSDANQVIKSRFGKVTTATKLLFYFGLLFTVSVVVLIFIPII